MSYAVAAATPIAGDNTGEFKDDLTSPIVGEWPKLDNISRITRIVIYAGSIIDSITFTYLLKTPVNGSTTAVVTHGGKGGKLALDYTLTAGQKIIAVYGRRLIKDIGFGKHNLVQLSFILATPGSGVDGDVKVDTPKSVKAGSVNQPNVQFDFSWALAGATSYTFQPPGKPNAYLQGLGFTEVLCQAGGPALI